MLNLAPMGLDPGIRIWLLRRRRKALVKKTAPALCWDCHDNFLEKAKFQHDVVEDCTGCHKPHQSAEPICWRRTF